MQHKDIRAGNQHIIHNWKVADIAERDALAVTNEDIDKICLVMADDFYYRLKSTNPTIWVQVSGSSGGSVAWGSVTGVLANQIDLKAALDEKEPADSTILKEADIGVKVQPYNANTVVDASYVHTDNNYTTAEKSKLASIAEGAEVNVNADWNATSGAAQILNKPTIYTKSETDSAILALIDDTIPSKTKVFSSLHIQTLYNAQAQTIANLSGASAQFSYNTTPWIIPGGSYSDLAWTNDSQSTNTTMFELGTDEINFKKDGNYNFFVILTYERLFSDEAVDVIFEMYDADEAIVLGSVVHHIDIAGGQKTTIPLNMPITITGATSGNPVRLKVRATATVVSGTISIFSFSAIVAAQSIVNIVEPDAVPTDGSTAPVQSNGVYDALSLKADQANTYTKSETNTQIDTAISSLIDAAPATLNTLNKLATAIGDDPNFAATIATELGNKANKIGADNIEITEATKGIILKSPNGTRYRIAVDDDGSIITTAV